MAVSYCIHDGDSVDIFHYENNYEKATMTIETSINYGRKMYKGEFKNYRYIQHNIKLVFINLDEENNFLHLSAINSLLKVFLQGKVKHGNELKINIPCTDDPDRTLYCKHSDKENGKSYIEIGMYDKSLKIKTEKFMMRMHIGYAHCLLNATNKAMALYQPNPYIQWEE